jgi:hypothetical protein
MPTPEPLAPAGPFVKVVQTCPSHPAQWDAWDAAGRYYYLRYRYGLATVEQHPSPDPNTWDPDPRPLGSAYGNPSCLVSMWESEQRRRGERDLDGYCSLEEFLQRVGLQLAPGADVS